MAGRRLGSVGVVFLCLALAGTARAQVDDRLEAYTGRNASGYLAPLVDAFRSDLNSGLFHSARVSPGGFHASLEFIAMSTFFGAASRTFLATTESPFTPEKVVRAPTVVGDTHAVYVTGDAATTFAFPGGFDVDHMILSCPQLRVGSWRGTEVVGRFIVYDAGSSDVGKLGLWGAGARHSVSQYVPRLAPFDVAVAAMWQHAQVENGAGQRVVSDELGTVAVQSGVSLGSLYPYAGVSVAWSRLKLRYRFDDSSGTTPIALDFDSNGDLQLTLGVSYQAGFVAAYGEYNVATESSVAAGLAVSYPFSNRSVSQ